MANIIFAILALCLLAILLVPRRQPSTIVYVQHEPAPESGLGCFALLALLGGLLVLALSGVLG